MSDSWMIDTSRKVFAQKLTTLPSEINSLLVKYLLQDLVSIIGTYCSSDLVQEYGGDGHYLKIKISDTNSSYYEKFGCIGLAWETQKVGLWRERNPANSMSWVFANYSLDGIVTELGKHLQQPDSNSCGN